MILDDIRIYLPKFLSADAEDELFNALKQFPDSIEAKRFYSTRLQEECNFFQGDGIRDMLVVNLPDTTVRGVPCFLLSNTCDMTPENKRLFPSQIVYAPIFNLDKYHKKLLQSSEKSPEQIHNHIDSIRKQRITQILYLPAIEGELNESIVFLDRVQNCSNSYVESPKIPRLRLFTLSDYGAYILLLKLSIHFTRIQDKVERGALSN